MDLEHFFHLGSKANGRMRRWQPIDSWIWAKNLNCATLGYKRWFVGMSYIVSMVDCSSKFATLKQRSRSKITSQSSRFKVRFGTWLTIRKMMIVKRRSTDNYAESRINSRQRFFLTKVILHRSRLMQWNMICVVELLSDLKEKYRQRRIFFNFTWKAFHVKDRYSYTLRTANSFR